jgi:prevent-host-death family protein
MQEVSIEYASQNIAQLLNSVAAGEEILISKAGRPIARLSPVDSVKQKRVLGLDKGKFEVPDDFDKPYTLMRERHEMGTD